MWQVTLVQVENHLHVYIYTHEERVRTNAIYRIYIESKLGDYLFIFFYPSKNVFEGTVSKG